MPTKTLFAVIFPVFLLFLLAHGAVPSPASALEERVAAEESPGGSGPAWGFGVRGGAYGVPDWLLDLLFEEHPDVDGSIVGAEIRYYGKGGPSGSFSVALTFDVGSTDGFGVWKEKDDDVPVIAGGAVDLMAGTLTAYWDIMPASMIHPYVGLGLGVGYAEGTYERDNETVTVEEFVPAVHIPVGLLLNLGPNFGLALEGRAIDGLAWGGMLSLRF